MLRDHEEAHDPPETDAPPVEEEQLCQPAGGEPAAVILEHLGDLRRCPRGKEGVALQQLVHPPIETLEKVRFGRDHRERALHELRHRADGEGEVLVLVERADAVRGLVEVVERVALTFGAPLLVRDSGHELVDVLLLQHFIAGPVLQHDDRHRHIHAGEEVELEKHQLEEHPLHPAVPVDERVQRVEGDLRDGRADDRVHVGVVHHPLHAREVSGEELLQHARRGREVVQNLLLAHHLVVLLRRHPVLRRPARLAVHLGLADMLVPCLGEQAALERGTERRVDDHAVPVPGPGDRVDEETLLPFGWELILDHLRRAGLDGGDHPGHAVEELVVRGVQPQVRRGDTEEVLAEPRRQLRAAPEPLCEFDDAGRHEGVRQGCGGQAEDAH
mmetsp:Transcript_99855/g.282620  ORF Transcript_99855/g.282620 Transcript_99855/m.282620 type:complete len:387 (-) Transcript_99855:402-1562(-)